MRTERWKTVEYTLHGQTASLTAWAVLLGYTPRSLLNKIRALGVDAALSTPAVSASSAGRRGADKAWRSSQSASAISGVARRAERLAAEAQRR